MAPQNLHGRAATEERLTREATEIPEEKHRRDRGVNGLISSVVAVPSVVNLYFCRCSGELSGQIRVTTPWLRFGK